MPLNCDLALHNIPLLKQPFKMQPHIENEDVTWSPQYTLPATRTNKHTALSIQKVQFECLILNGARHFVPTGTHLVYLGAQCRPSGHPWAQNVWL